VPTRCRTQTPSRKQIANFDNRAVSKLQELLSGNSKTGINFRARNVLRAAVENQTSFAFSFKVSEAGLGFVLKLVIAATK
jgi:hypothetical protein